MIYGDTAYGVSRNTLSPYHGAHITLPEHEFNKSMNQVTSVLNEVLEKPCQYFAFVDFKKNNKVLLQPVGKYCLVAALLMNCHTCLYGSQKSILFDLQPLALNVYISKHL